VLFRSLGVKEFSNIGKKPEDFVDGVFGAATTRASLLVLYAYLSQVIDKTRTVGEGTITGKSKTIDAVQSVPSGLEEQPLN